MKALNDRRQSLDQLDPSEYGKASSVGVSVPLVWMQRAWVLLMEQNRPHYLLHQMVPGHSPAVFLWDAVPVWTFLN